MKTFFNIFFTKGKKYDADLCYTPMLHAKLFLEKEAYRKTFFSTTKLDRPLIAQFCANDPDTLLEAAKLLCSMAEIDGVDINFGVSLNSLLSQF